MSIKKAMLPITLILMIGNLLLVQKSYSAHDSTKLSYNTISIGCMVGTSKVFMSSDAYKSGNFGKYGEFDHSFSALAVGIERTVQLNKGNLISFGVNYFRGTHRELFQIFRKVNGPTVVTTGDEEFTYYGVKPYIQYDAQFIGIGVGFHFGQLGKITYPSNNYQSPDASSVRQFNYCPSLIVRVGNLSEVFLEYRMADQFPSNFPSLSHQLVFGFGFRKRWNQTTTVVRIGSASTIAFFIEPSIPIGDHLVVEPYLGFGYGLPNLVRNLDGAEETFKSHIASIVLHYKFNKKERNR